jgi:Holliday junction DNA helicase RuvB
MNEDEKTTSGLEERRDDRALRPSSLAEFIGQRLVAENLRIAAFSAKRRGDALDHILLSGMPGLGKTTLASLLAKEMGVGLHVTSGPAVGSGEDLLGQLTSLKRGDILFVDEIHRLSRQAEEYVYSAMEDLEVHLVLAQGHEARAIRVRVEPFTLVGATTREGMLSAPFRGRFGIVEKLEPYPPEDLYEILTRSATLLHCEFAPEAARYLAERSRGTPRHANRFLRRVRHLALYRANGANGDGSVRLTLDVVKEQLQRLGIDERGLDRVDRRILEALLASEKPVGLKTLAVQVGEDEGTLEDVYEPYLMQRGLLVKTPRGRSASERAVELLPCVSRAVELTLATEGSDLPPGPQSCRR